MRTLHGRGGDAKGLSKAGILEVVERLAAAEQRLRELSAGQIDAVLHPAGYVHLLRDAQAALLASERKYREIFDSSGDGLLLVDPAPGRVLDANRRVAQESGYSHEECLGMEAAHLLAGDPAGAPAIEARLAAARDGGPQLFEVRARRRSGEAMWTEILLHRTLIEGKPMLLAIVRYIDERKEADELRQRTSALELENERILALSRMKNEFLANMSHELRTPLNAVIGFAELLEDGHASLGEPQGREFLANILTSSRHLLRLINDVLDLAKVEAGRMELWPEEIDVGAIVGEVLTILRVGASKKRLAVTAEIDPALGTVLADPARLRQVLYNYVSNALKFTPVGGSVTVRARVEDAAMFVVEVSDTGPGIAESDQGRLFKEFPRLEHATRGATGAGLGLALTRRIVEVQGGSVGVRSVPGQGAIFFARLPRDGTAAAEQSRRG